MREDNRICEADVEEIIRCIEPLKTVAKLPPICEADVEEILRRIEPLKTVAKLPPIVEDGKYTMVVPYVELRTVLREMSDGVSNGMVRP